MTDSQWRPLGVDDEDEVSEYDALHDGVPAWMSAPYWAWVRESLTLARYESARYNGRKNAHLNEALTEEMAQTLRIHLPDLRYVGTDRVGGQRRLTEATAALQRHERPLQIADYLLAYGAPDVDTLEGVLERSKSAWRVGERAGRRGLVRRVAAGVQAGADAVIARSGRAGRQLAVAWEKLYGLDPDPSQAYRLAILAVEDAAIPVVSPTYATATLGTVLRQLEDQGDWSLPLSREHPKAPGGEVVMMMMRALWHGQHDRHGGQPSAPGKVSYEEAVVAVGLATALVQWFTADFIQRKP